MSTSDERSSRELIDECARRFFAAFDNRAGRSPELERLRELFTDGAVVVKVAGGAHQAMSVEAFIAPRRALLTGGALVDFHEWEDASETSVLGGIAWRRSTYRKSGTLNGAPYAGGGVKLFSFVAAASGWRIASVAWEDDETATD